MSEVKRETKRVPTPILLLEYHPEIPNGVGLVPIPASIFTRDTEHKHEPPPDDGVYVFEFKLNPIIYQPTGTAPPVTRILPWDYVVPDVDTDDREIVIEPKRDSTWNNLRHSGIFAHVTRQ